METGHGLPKSALDLNVVLFSDRREPGLRDALDRAAAWVRETAVRPCRVRLWRYPPLQFRDQDHVYEAAVMAVVDKYALPPGRYVCLVRGAGGYAGATMPRPGYGVAALGDWCLDALTVGAYPADVPADHWIRRFPPHTQAGALLHEWGHLYGADHPPEGTDGDGLLMGSWWGYPDVALPYEVVHG